MEKPMDELRQFALTYLELDNRIQNQSILEFTKEALSYVKDDFFWQPASSSGKYHPDYALGVGGLLKHTKATLVFAEQLFPIYNFKPKMRDYIISALTLHDTEKPSKTHPIEVKLRLEPLRDKYYYIFETVIPLIESHMGQWDQFGKLPTPHTPQQHFVHLCDYLASRENVTINLKESRV